ncbi:odorant receptor Or2-like isoform X2 [Augochlora pura]
MMNFFRLHIKEIGAAVATFSLLSTVVNLAVKMIRFTLHREKLSRIYNTLEILYQESVMKQPPESAAFGYLYICYRLASSLYIINLITMLLLVTKPLIVIVFRNGAYTYVVPSAYPWPITSTFSYAMHYIAEASVASTLPFVSAGVDTFFMMCALRVCSVLRAMAVELEELAKRSNDIETHRRLLRKCIDRHATLVACGDGIQEVFAPVVLSFTLTNGIGMCSMIFEILRAEEIPIEKVFTLSLYFSSKVVQTLIYAWPGNMITSENEAFCDEVSYNNWYERSDAQTGKLCVTILSQRLMVLRVFNILEITLDLFAKIMNKTISYYFLLVTLESDE